MNRNLLNALRRFTRKVNDPNHVRPVDDLPDEREKLYGKYCEEKKEG